ncbi:hypothetical protein KAR91_65265 [Candidatus Pacearchaeota archaeon]|nr:hypothetical protein [Candidatus Pacearchaeota archaeon]
MKRLFTIFILVLLCVSVSFAGDRIFEWDQNTEADLKGYKIYRSATPNVQVDTNNLYLNVWKPGENPDVSNPKNAEYVVGSAGQCVLARSILPDGTYYFVLTAFDNSNNESGKSNEVSTVIDDTAPAPPNGFQCNTP